MMNAYQQPWEASSEFVLRLADLSAAQIDGSIRRTSRYNSLCMRQLAAQLPTVISPTASNVAELQAVSRSTQDELFEDGCNMLQIAFMVESELMYWTDRLTQAWFEDPTSDVEH